MLAYSNTNKEGPRHPTPSSKTAEPSQTKLLDGTGEPKCTARKAESKGPGQEKLCKNDDSPMCALSKTKDGKSMHTMPETGRKLSKQLDCLNGSVDSK